MRLPPSVPLTDTSPGVFESSFDYYGSANLFWGKRSRTHNPAFDRAFRIRMDEFLNSGAGDEPTDGQRFGAWLRAAYSSMVDYDGFMDEARKLEPGIMAEVDAAFQSQQGQYIEDLAYQRDRALMVSERASPGWVSGFGRMGAEMAGAILGDADPLMLATFYFGAPYRAAATAKSAWRPASGLASRRGMFLRDIGKRKYFGEGGIFRTAGRQAATDMAAVAALSGPAGYLDKLWLDSVGVSEELQIAKMTERWMEVPFAGALRGAGSLAIDAAANSRLFYRPRTEINRSQRPFGGILGGRLTQVESKLGLRGTTSRPLMQDEVNLIGGEDVADPAKSDLTPAELMDAVDELGADAAGEFWGTTDPDKQNDILEMIGGLDATEYNNVLKRFDALSERYAKKPDVPLMWNGKKMGEMRPEEVAQLAWKDKTGALKKFFKNPGKDYENAIPFLQALKKSDPAKFEEAATAVVRASIKENELRQVATKRNAAINTPALASQGGGGFASLSQRARIRARMPGGVGDELPRPIFASQGGDFATHARREQEYRLPQIFSKMLGKDWEAMKKHAPELYAKFYPLWRSDMRSLIKFEGGGQKMSGGGVRWEVEQQIRSLGLESEKLTALRKDMNAKVRAWFEMRDSEGVSSAQLESAKKKAQRSIMRVAREEVKESHEIFENRFERTKTGWRPRDVLTASPDARAAAAEASISPSPPPKDINIAEESPKTADVVDAAFTNQPPTSAPVFRKDGKMNPADDMIFWTRSIRESEISINSDVYQHRVGVDKDGKEKNPEGIAEGDPIDPIRLGSVMVHELRDGRLMLVDGHQRINRMRKDRVDGDGEDQILEDAIVLREEDGWTAGMARERGAWMNLAGGHQRRSAPWEAADFLRNKSALGDRFLERNSLLPNYKKNFDAGRMLNHFHPAALDKSAEGMQRSQFWGMQWGRWHPLGGSGMNRCRWRRLNCLRKNFTAAKSRWMESAKWKI